MHPVLKLLLKRGRQGSQPARRYDGARLGLAIEGGGMRGVVSAGMAAALEYLGLLNAFDVVYGSSAGALNAAYFVAGQAAQGATIYYDDINCSRFASLWRSVGSRPIMSLDYLFDHVMARRKVLDWQTILDSAVRLKMVASSVEERRVSILDGFEDREALFAALRASSNIPLIAGPPAIVGDRRYLDALLYEPIPFQSALAGGCTHVLALLSRPDGCLQGRPSFLERHLVGRWIASIEPQLVEPYLATISDYDHQIERLRAATSEPQGPPYLYALSIPSTVSVLGNLEKDRSRLVAGAVAGMNAVFERLLEDRPQV